MTLLTQLELWPYTDPLPPEPGLEDEIIPDDEEDEDATKIWEIEEGN